VKEYQLKPWSNYVRDKHGKDYQSALAELQKPDLTEMAVHYLKESQRAIRFEQQNGKAEPDPCWNSLADTATEALVAITTEDPREIASAFYNLGQSSERLLHPSIDKRIEHSAAYIEKLKSEKKLKEHTLKRNFLKEVIQDKALKRWATDTDKDFRLAEMSQLLLQEAQDIAREIDTEVPTKVDTLKPWLREVAPEYAKKPGRPKKAEVIM
jgi:hypothetical protein